MEESYNKPLFTRIKTSDDFRIYDSTNKKKTVSYDVYHQLVEDNIRLKDEVKYLHGVISDLRQD